MRVLIRYECCQSSLFPGLPARANAGVGQLLDQGTPVPAVQNSSYSPLFFSIYSTQLLFFMCTLRENIIRIRKSKGIYQKQIAKALGFMVNVITQIEAGNRKVKSEEVPMIAKALGVGMDDLFACNCQEKQSPYAVAIKTDQAKIQINFTVAIPIEEISKQISEQLAIKKSE